MIKNLAKIFLTLVLNILIGSFAFAWSGNGTEQNPYQISTVAELQKLATNVNNGTSYNGKHFKLMNDIDLKEIANFTPIGKNESYSFQGVFDGNGQKIEKLKINITSARGEVFAGLFGCIKSATIKNVGLKKNSINVNVSNNVYAGGLVGVIKGTCTIDSCYTTGDVSPTVSLFSSAGGLVGNMNSGTITNCYATGTVFSSSDAGGLVGRMNSGTIINCYATGDVSSYSYSISSAGGLVGSISSGTIDSCYAIGAVPASSSNSFFCAGGWWGMSWTLAPSAIVIGMRKPRVKQTVLALGL